MKDQKCTHSPNIAVEFDRRKTSIKMTLLKQKSSETHLNVILHDTGALSPKPQFFHTALTLFQLV